MTSRMRPGRRALLIGTAAAVAGLVTSCMSGSSPHPAPAPTPTPPSPDELAAGRAVRTARVLLAAESSSTGATPRLAALLGTLAATQRAHLQALGLPAPSPSASGPVSGASSASATGSPPATGSPSATGVDLAALAQAERAGAQEALADVSITTPVTAGLLARIAAARAVDADLIRSVAGLAPLGELTLPTAPSTPTPTPTAAPSTPTPTPAAAPAATAPSPAAVTSGATWPSASPTPSESATIDTADAAALSALLAGEHAAVFAYGLVAARAPAARQRLARSLWQAHRQRRDELERRLAAAGRTPAAAEPAYDIGAVPTSPARLAALAARVEDGLAAAAFGAVTRTEGAVRDEAAADLVRAARRAAVWRGSGTALPGTPS